jgi:hypothetical protein
MGMILVPQVLCGVLNPGHPTFGSQVSGDLLHFALKRAAIRPYQLDHAQAAVVAAAERRRGSTMLKAMRTACVLLVGLSAMACNSGATPADKGGEGNGAGHGGLAGTPGGNAGSMGERGAGHVATGGGAGNSMGGGSSAAGSGGPQSGHGSQSGSGATAPPRAHVMFRLKGVQ